MGAGAGFAGGTALGTLAAACALILAPPVVAQETAAGAVSAAPVLEEIIVTATRRAERLQDVPVSVSAFNAEDLAARSVATVGDILQYSPNVARSSGPAGGQDAYFFIRGVGQIDNSIVLDPGVGVYVDGVYLGRVQGSSIDLVDIERIEVLRGPQGTLFGRNTIGGAVNITSRPPGDSFGAQGRLTIGSRERREAQASVNVPVGDTLAVTASGLRKQQDGWGRNALTGETFGDVDITGGRVALRWTPTPVFTAGIAGDYAENRGSPSHTVLTGIDRTPSPAAAATLRVTQKTSPFLVPLPADMERYIQPADSRTNFLSIPAIYNTDAGGVSATLEWQGDAATVKSISAWRTLEQVNWSDFDGSPYAFYDSSNDLEQDQFSQELQVNGRGFGDRLDWLVGGYFFKEDMRNTVTVCLGTTGPVATSTLQNPDGSGRLYILTPPGPGPGRPPPVPVAPAAQILDPRCMDSSSTIDLDVESLAAFTHNTFDLTDRLEAVVGLRYTVETKNQRFNTFLDNRDGVLAFTPVPIAALPFPGRLTVPARIVPQLSPANTALRIPTTYEETWTDLSTRFGLNYRVSDDILVYASYAEGFKSGGFNGRGDNAVLSNSNVQPFDPEHVTTYEAGAKTELLDRRLRLNGAVFLSRYDDIQLLALNPQTALFETRNAGEAEILGAEAEVLAAPVDGVVLNLGIGWLDAEYETLRATSTDIQIDDALPVTPEWTFNAGAQYSLDLSGRGELTFRADYSWQDEVSYQVGNDPLEIGPSYGLLNLRATYTTTDERISVSVFGTNVTNEDYLRSAQDSRSDLGTAYATPGAPREWGLELRVKF
jgi:iron complex outermembrane receptor protein